MIFKVDARKIKYEAQPSQVGLFVRTLITLLLFADIAFGRYDLWEARTENLSTANSVVRSLESDAVT